MYLGKVKDLEAITLGKNQVLVEFIEKTSSIILAGADGPSSTLTREQVFLSNAEGIEKGDVILEAKYGMGGDISVHKIDGKRETVGEGKNKISITVDDRKFAVIMGHDIKMWTKSENFILD